jgi:uncharacterized protein YeaO (DUF488 family)
MSIRIVRLGTPRAADEGTRIGTVRRPPRGVPKSEFSKRDWYDVWYPNLAPSAPVMTLGRTAKTAVETASFLRKYRSEMRAHDASRSIDVLAALSHHANFSVGCYCEDESRCHRSALRHLLADRGAIIEA